mmetsp:Transcript_49371/g.138277  ORF Transcript_49371/g.138277 Transcript_49371/m.138277 type:complete len:214 (+) Transcript_49371:1520-2161(+)
MGRTEVHPCVHARLRSPRWPRHGERERLPLRYEEFHQGSPRPKLLREDHWVHGAAAFVRGHGRRGAHDAAAREPNRGRRRRGPLQRPHEVAQILEEQRPGQGVFQHLQVLHALGLVRRDPHAGCGHAFLKRRHGRRLPVRGGSAAGGPIRQLPGCQPRRARLQDRVRGQEALALRDDGQHHGRDRRVHHLLHDLHLRHDPRREERQLGLRQRL